MSTAELAYSPRPAADTTVNRVAQVELVLSRLRPAMEADAGGVELVSVSDDGVVTVRLRGTCLVCPSVNLTMKLGIEKTLREQLGWVTEVKKEQ